jgi:hypothetical protein
MKKLLELRWYLAGTVLITAILDLITLPVADVSAAWILLMILAGVIVFYHPKKKV